MRFIAWCCLILTTISGTSFAQSPSAAVFGALPTFDDVAISPDGRKLALLGNFDGQSAVYVRDIESGAMTPLVSAGETKARSVGWANNETILFWVSNAARSRYFTTSLLEFSSVHAVSISGDERSRALLRGSRELALNSSLGNVLSTLPGDDDHILMQAFGFSSREENAIQDRKQSVFKVRLKSGRGAIEYRGSDDTRDFFVDDNGAVFSAR